MFPQDFSILERLRSLPLVRIMHQLSEHDKAVLNSIFNPLLPLGEGTFSDEFISEALENEDDKDPILTPEVAEIQRRAILETEAKNYEEALRLFGEAIKSSEFSANLLNDRAQCFRLAGLNNEAMEDLNLALQVSKGRGRSGVRALCQRGILFRVEGKLDEARSDFTEAANRGSKFARSQLVELNPYAAMCNQMLREITTKLNNP